ncbi:DUF559 domain-containing protein [Plantibacter sp. Leaf314]|uniref:DUF559 domain-containing protein n=1 Tax=Plantibacter sp. Leaf314 TaxID=1736333 RepID=UPI0006F8656A|nr:hypothetical protein ASF68_17420 [Plantibacter sp. Leaf314]
MTIATTFLEPAHGIATVHQLRRLGHTKETLRIAVETGMLIRVRRGWYAAPDAPSDLVRAVRVGGRLSCVSAARWYGWAVPSTSRLHVALPPNAARLRSADERWKRPPAEAREDAVLHWDDWPPAPPRGTLLPMLVESRRQVIGHLVDCQHPEVVGAAMDSFTHLEPALSAALPSWIDALPSQHAERLPRVEPGCHSVLESIARIRLESAGIVGRHQVAIPAVGRVDQVIDGWLVLEWDGREFHDNRDAHEEDRWRDAQLVVQGYRVLRFTYRMVMNDWYVVLGAIRSALDAGPVGPPPQAALRRS